MGVGVSPSPLFFLIMDTKLTNRIIAWLESSHDDDSNIIGGATLMLQCNRNRILYNNVLRKPANFVGKIDYELRKHLRYRKDSDRKSTRLNSSQPDHLVCRLLLEKKKKKQGSPEHKKRQSTPSRGDKHDTRR